MVTKNSIKPPKVFYVIYLPFAKIQIEINFNIV